MSNPADYDICDEHEQSFIRHSFCPYCRITELEAENKILKDSIAQLCPAPTPELQATFDSIDAALDKERKK